MFKSTKTFTSFSVDNLEKAEAFYGDRLGLNTQKENKMGLSLALNGSTVFVYPKDDHQPATFTVLNFVVDDLDSAMDDLADKGISFIQYDNDDLPQDEKGVLRGLEAGMGPDIAWFKDPAGNVLSVLQEK